MGHADIQTTMRYLHHVPAHDDAAGLTAAFTPDVASVTAHAPVVVIAVRWQSAPRRGIETPMSRAGASAPALPTLALGAGRQRAETVHPSVHQPPIPERD
jgi:hypothetical protein